MNRAWSLVLVLLTFTLGCTAAAAEREIGNYPFIATSERAATIRNGYKRITAGMTAVEVAAILGEPDEIHALHEPKIKDGKVAGYTHWYVIRRLAKSGSADEKQESLVRVSFDLKNRVTTIDAWGL